MNVIKRARAALRATLTKAVERLDEALQKEEKDSSEIKSQMELIVRKRNELRIINHQIYEKLLEDENIQQDFLEKEIEQSDQYELKFNMIQAKVDILNVQMKAESASQVLSAQNVQQESRRPFRLPQLELKKFSGKLKEWLPFWAQFSKIHEDMLIDSADKFQYLIQATVPGSRARNLVESFPATSENYAKALQCLQDRYGREDLLVEVYVRELLGLVLKNTRTSETISLSDLYDSIEGKLRALEALQVTTEKCSSMLMPLVESCLPEEVLRTWQRSSCSRSVSEHDTSTTINKSSSRDRLERLMRFLRKELENEQKISLALSGFDNKNSSVKEKDRSQKYLSNSKKLPTAAGLLTTVRESRCVFCGNIHKSVECVLVKSMTLEERKAILAKKQCCYNCLKIGHRVAKCRSRIKCLRCNKKHNIIICDSSARISNVANDKDESTNINTKSDKVLANLDKPCDVRLQTFLVKLLKNNGASRIARAIIDTASQRSYLLCSVATEMCYKAIRKEKIQHTLFGGLHTNVVEHNVFAINVSNMDNTFSCSFEVLDQMVICDKIYPAIDCPWLGELEENNIQFNDYENRPVEILIGADTACRLLTGRQYHLSCGLVALETKLGWTVMGCVTETLKQNGIAMTVTTMLTKEFGISDYWSLDVLGITDPIEKKKKQELAVEAQQHFQKTVTLSDDGRYIVHIPWLEDHPPLTSNYNIALKRLESTVKKLKGGGIYDDYDRVFKEWCVEGIIEEVPEEDLTKTAHYLPHRPIIKHNSTTKIRPVFDASAKERNCASLNDCVEKGVNLIELIPSILLRFRLGKIGVISDIKKAFLQIGLLHGDRDFLRFLWYDEKKNLKIYRHRRVVFGVSCSPFLLGSVIQYHLEKIKNKCADGIKDYDMTLIEKLMNGFYVDNCVTSVKNETELRKFINEATAMMAEGKFELRGWEYSYPEVNLLGEPGYSNVLGILWNRQCDTIEVNLTNYDFSCSSPVKVTKRAILSAAHRLFDPIGFTCPVMLLPKSLLQKIWVLKLNWDQEVDESTKKIFLNWQQELLHVKQIKLPRWILYTEETAKYSLHIFCDASQIAYATAAFLRTETTSIVHVQLVQAKSRVSPLNKQNKGITIPRLELLAANMGARLYASIIKDLDLTLEEVIFWSDSTTVLAWINREEQWDVFVRNRVKEVRDLTCSKQWQYISGTDNPADLPSRGCSAKKLLESRWWEGPCWLRERKDSWPSFKIVYDESEICKEKKKAIISTVMICTDEESNWYYRYFSKYNQIVRLIAWLLRFKENTLSSRETRLHGDIETEEFMKAEIKLFRLVQEESFQGIRDDKLGSLCPYMEEDGLIRLKTKVSYGDYVKDFCYPIVLPNQNHPVVKRLILEVHCNYSHAGTQILMVILRKRFWILGGRRTVRSVVTSCVVCSRYRSKKIQVQSPPLPEDRVRDAKVYEIVGIDLAGPLYIKVKGRIPLEKCWICLFTCAVYRAIHLELISSLSTDRFIQCLRKFISRWGRPSVIYTDNGTNFVGAANMLERLDWNKIKQHSSINRIRWKFNPPTAAWWGGWWERLIGLLKHLLRKVLGKTSLDFEEMQTILYECEAVLNARPLTYVSEDISDLTPLTPDMFLREIENDEMPDLDAVETKSLNRRLKYRRHLRQILKLRFREEYLGQLVLHSKKFSSRKIEVGEMVLVESRNLKRIEWPLARVEALIPGREGDVRLVKLRTATGVVLRPVQRIFPLEIKFTPPTEEKAMIQERHKEKDVMNNFEPSENPIEANIIYTRSGRRVKAPLRLKL